MTPQEIRAKEEIEKLTHEEMARLWRFAPAGHPYFIYNGLYYFFFKERFSKFGGMTTEISKKIGL